MELKKVPYYSKSIFDWHLTLRVSLLMVFTQIYGQETGQS
ncbi:hypothetical protein A936_06931 [Enterobacter sp. Ag1]|nr:hypothetical protein A936_06931 [Enterobacter sp. Ag1]